VAILNGGLPKWLAEERPTEAGQYELYPDKSSTPDEGFDFAYNPELVATYSQVAEASKNKTAQIVDARKGTFFNADVTETFPGLSAGHIPNSTNKFFKPAVYNKDNTFKSAEEL
jgi:thiosulfate/3-mercaptopyruvate sulfurtransferase